jgi:hypothetical protein
MCDPTPAATSPPPRDDVAASTLAAIDLSLDRVALAIKEEKRLALSLLATISRKDADPRSPKSSSIHHCSHLIIIAASKYTAHASPWSTRA